MPSSSAQVRAIFTGIYQSILGREPDEAGLAHWVAAFTAAPTHATLRECVLGIVDSGEFRAIARTLGATVPRAARPLAESYHELVNAGLSAAFDTANIAEARRLTLAAFWYREDRRQPMVRVPDPAPGAQILVGMYDRGRPAGDIVYRVTEIDTADPGPMERIWHIGIQWVSGTPRNGVGYGIRIPGVTDQAEKQQNLSEDGTTVATTPNPLALTFRSDHLIP